MEVEVYGDEVASAEARKMSVVVGADTESAFADIPMIVWYVVGGVSAAIILSCSLAAVVITKKKKRIVKEEK